MNCVMDNWGAVVVVVRRVPSYGGDGCSLCFTRRETKGQAPFHTSLGQGV